MTGALGGSMAGRHLTFEPRIGEAVALAALLGDRLHAMIDLSDGLGRDGGHIAEQSGVGLEIDAATLPCTAGVDWKAALSDGEDYELCFTAVGEVPDVIDGLAVTTVGEVVEAMEDARVIVRSDGDRYRADEFGWQHST